MRRPTASFWLALLIVSGAMVTVLVTKAAHPGAWWGRIAWVAIERAWMIAFAFGGGPHGDLTGKWWYDVPVTFVVALAMWWAALEGCRRLWNRKREVPWVIGSIVAATAVCWYRPEYGSPGPYSPVPFLFVVFYVMSGAARLLLRLVKP